jgi:hypothetical protein
MSKFSQYIAYINSKYEPTAIDMKFTYDSISKTPELKEARREYQLQLKKNLKQFKNVKNKRVKR